MVGALMDAILRSLPSLFVIAPPAHGAGLSAGERVRAETLAGTVPWSAPAGTARARPGAAGPDDAGADDPRPAGSRSADPRPAGPPRGGPRPLGVQTPVTELDAGKGERPTSGARECTSTTTTRAAPRRVLVELVSGRALGSRVVTSPHLPLNAAERAWAPERLAASGPVPERLREERRSRGGEAFAAARRVRARGGGSGAPSPALGVVLAPSLLARRRRRASYTRVPFRRRPRA